MISKSISEISCDKHEFEKAKGDYNKALEKSGFSEKIKYHKQGPVKRVRTRNVYGLTLHTVAMSRQMLERPL